VSLLPEILRTFEFSLLVQGLSDVIAPVGCRVLFRHVTLRFIEFKSMP